MTCLWSAGFRDTAVNRALAKPLPLPHPSQPASQQSLTSSADAMLGGPLMPDRHAAAVQPLPRILNRGHQRAASQPSRCRAGRVHRPRCSRPGRSRRAVAIRLRAGRSGIRARRDQDRSKRGQNVFANDLGGAERTWNSEAETSSQNHSLITATPRSGKTVTSVPVTPYTTSVDVNSGTAWPEERAEMSMINVCVPDESK